MPLRLFFLEFPKGYHVGWRKASMIVDHTTLLRALASVAYMVDDQFLVNEIVEGKLATSSLLPSLASADRQCYRLLTVFPTLPSLVKLSKLGVSWATLPAVREVLVFVRECVEGGGAPVIVGGGDDFIEIGCGDRSLRLKVVERIACVDGDDCRLLGKPRLPLFEKIEEYHNRIDRVTGSADLFRLEGWKTNTPLWACFKGSSEALAHVESLLKILGELGLGAYRSRGWGAFRVVEDVKPCDIDGKVLDRNTGWETGYNLLLGSILPGEPRGWLDESRSFALPTVIGGIAGPVFEEYRLPLIRALGVGGLVYAKSKPRARVVWVRTSVPGRGVWIVFNPLVVNSIGS